MVTMGWTGGGAVMVMSARTRRRPDEGADGTRRCARSSGGTAAATEVDMGGTAAAVMTTPASAAHVHGRLNYGRFGAGRVRGRKSSVRDATATATGHHDADGSAWLNASQNAQKVSADLEANLGQESEAGSSLRSRVRGIAQPSVVRECVPATANAATAVEQNQRRQQLVIGGESEALNPQKCRSAGRATPAECGGGRERERAAVVKEQKADSW